MGQDYDMQHEMVLPSEAYMDNQLQQSPGGDLAYHLTRMPNFSLLNLSRHKL